MDVLLTMLCAADVNFVITVPGSDDVMLNYQTLSHHDSIYARETLKHRPAPEFEEWLVNMGVTDAAGHMIENPALMNRGLRELDFLGRDAA